MVRRLSVLLWVLAVTIPVGCGDSSSGDGEGGGSDSCASDQTSCDDACVDTETNSAHCGRCGEACALGTSCSMGECGSCPSGLESCSGACTIVSDDPENCGACGESCSLGQACADGSCSCPEGTAACDDRCVDQTTSVEHCGDCGNSCVPGELCSDGACECLPGLTACEGECVDTESSAAHCGACDAACSAREVCLAGSCEADCGSRTQCGQDCVDVTASARHCGDCDSPCSTGESCEDGECTCAPGLRRCGTACVNTTSDPENCGQCGTTCATGQSCVFRECECPKGQVLCGSSCTNRTNNPQHCGTCNNACTGGRLCNGTTCECASGRSFCDGACVDTETDEENCGGCGRECSVGQSCASGTCAGGSGGAGGGGAGGMGAMSGAGGAGSGAGGSGGSSGTLGSIIVSAGAKDRDHTIVSFPFPNGVGKALALRDSQGNQIPLHMSPVDGTATFILGALSANLTATYTIVELASPPAADVTAAVESNQLYLSIGTTRVFRWTLTDDNFRNSTPNNVRSGYIYPLYTPGGKNVVDDYPADQPHTHGIWSAWVATTFRGHSVDFWNGYNNQGRVDLESMGVTWSGPVHAGLVANIVHTDITTNPQVDVLNERWVVTVYKTHDGTPPYFIFDIDSVQTTATSDPLILEQFHYGGFGFRGAQEWLTAASFLTSEGHDRASGDGQDARWCAQYADVNGSPGGYAGLGHPSNLRAPQGLRIHPTYPYWAFLPVTALNSGQYTIQVGVPYRSRFRVVTFDGNADAALLNRLWDDYATPPTVQHMP